jgi:hypothetical protein
MYPNDAPPMLGGCEDDLHICALNFPAPLLDIVEVASVGVEPVVGSGDAVYRAKYLRMHVAKYLRDVGLD